MTLICPFWLSSRSRELLAWQKFMTILMGHKASCVAKQHRQLRKSAVDFSQLLTVDGEGCTYQLFNFFLEFLGLLIFIQNYCIWLRTREPNFKDVLSYNWPLFLIMSRLNLKLPHSWPESKESDQELGNFKFSLLRLSRMGFFENYISTRANKPKIQT